MSEIVVIGSLNVDVVVKTEKIPKTGETVLGEDYYLMPGGKGFNQASNIGWLGKGVSLIGCVGNDDNGKFLIQKINRGVDGSRIKQVRGKKTGMAVVTISEGDNCIIVIPGANHSLNTDMIKENLDMINKARLVVLQLEISMEVVTYIVDYCYEKGIKVLLNPAPAIRLSPELIDKVSYITPNLGECSVVFHEEDVESLLFRNQGKLIVTCGENGVMYCENDRIVRKKAEKVKVVDTTGAGDAFNGAFAVGIVEGHSISESIEIANKHAAKVVQVLGTLL